MKKNKRFLSLILSVAMIISMIPSVIAQDAPATGKLDSNVSIIPGENNFYVVLTDPIQQNKMTYRDGKPEGITDPSHELYTEDFTMDGITARKTYAANKVYIDMDKTKYDVENDSRWMVTITYYDFGPQVGYFYFDYVKKDGTSGRYTVEKPGIVPKWSTVRFYIDDAKFDSNMPNGSDFCLTTRTYNAWAKIELINIAEIEKAGGEVEGFKIPTVNSIQAESLHSLGLYNMLDENGKPIDLGANMTRGDMLYELLMGWGMKKELEAASDKSEFFTDVSGKYAKATNVALDLGIISKPADKKFNTDRLATAREMLTFSLRMFFPQLENIYEKAYDYASEKQFVKNTDFILYPDRPLIRDNFVAVVFNNLFASYKLKDGTSAEYIVCLMEKGLFTAQQLADTGVPEVAGYKYALPTPYPSREMTCPNTGNKYRYINLDNSDIEPPYVNKQMFNYDGTKFVFRHHKTKSIYEYDIVNETVRYISRAADAFYVSPKNILYYVTENYIWAMDWNTYEKRKVCKTPITNYLLVSTDEKYASGRSGIQSGSQTGRQNLTTGEVEWVKHDFYSVNPNSMGIGHTNVNPGYPHLLFFCHEGTTTVIPDRLWMHNYETNETYNFFVQAGEPGSFVTGECSGHEVWSMTGDYMYWVKYYQPQQNLGQSGFMRMDKDGKEREYINGDYSIWHCYPSGDDNWVVGDINNDTVGKAAEVGAVKVAIANCNTYESWPIAWFRLHSGSHPYQPHPHFNYGSNMIEWQMVDENNVLGVAWMDVSELTKDPRKNTDVVINDKLTLLTNEKYGEYQVKQIDWEGEKAWDIPRGHKMFVKVNDDYLYSDNVDELTVELTYWDQGRTPISFAYTSVIESQLDLADREDQIVQLPKDNSKGWATKRITLKKASINNRGQHKTDFVIFTSGSKTVIKDIKIIEE